MVCRPISTEEKFDGLISGGPIMDRSKKTIAKQKSYAWASYFKAQRESHVVQLQLLNNLRSYEMKLKNLKNAELPRFLVDEIVSMTNNLEKQIECPVCMKHIPTDSTRRVDVECAGELVVTLCGHKICRECYSNSAIRACPTCRKPFAKKKM